MTLSEAIPKLNYALRGLDDDAPLSGTDEWDYWVDVINSKKDELFEDTTKRWSNTYETRSLGTITATATPSFNLPADFLAASGDDSTEGRYRTGAYIIRTDGTRYNLTSTVPSEKNTNRSFYIAGMNPEVLYITNEITADENIVGGELFLMGFWRPDDISEDDDVLPFLSPRWAIMSSATEIAFNDIIYESKVEGLNAKSNNLWKMLVRRNNRTMYGTTRSIPVSVPKITSSNRSRSR